MPEGYARLPGAGYEALHPELKDVNPEDYPDIHKMAILADVAPYSREYNTYRQRVGKQAPGNTELEIEYEKILNRVKKTRESVICMQDRHFTAPVDEIAGTVNEVSPGGITLKEYLGRRFQFSSVSTRGEHRFPLSAIFEIHYRQWRICSYKPIYINYMHPSRAGDQKVPPQLWARIHSPKPKTAPPEPACLRKPPLCDLYFATFPLPDRKGFHFQNRILFLSMRT